MNYTDDVLLEKIENIIVTMNRIEGWLTELNNRVGNLERWKSYILGGLSMLAFLLGLIGIKAFF